MWVFLFLFNNHKMSSSELQKLSFSLKTHIVKQDVKLNNFFHTTHNDTSYEESCCLPDESQSRAYNVYAFFILTSSKHNRNQRGKTFSQQSKKLRQSPSGFNHGDAQRLGTFKEARNQTKPHLTWRRILQAPQEYSESIQQCGLEA